MIVKVERILWQSQKKNRFLIKVDIFLFVRMHHVLLVLFSNLYSSIIILSTSLLTRVRALTPASKMVLKRAPKEREQEKQERKISLLLRLSWCEFWNIATYILCVLQIGWIISWEIHFKWCGCPFCFAYFFPFCWAQQSDIVSPEVSHFTVATSLRIARAV